METTIVYWSSLHFDGYSKVVNPKGGKKHASPSVSDPANDMQRLEAPLSRSNLGSMGILL